MRNSSNLLLSQADPSPPPDETAWSLPGGLIGFASWLLALSIPFVIYGPNTLFFFLYTWPFFLALMPVAVVVGIAMHSLLRRRVLYTIAATLLTSIFMFGVIFMWLMS
ncbi:DUF3561 family protein [Entomohabitans teleogrylli]|uniref:DUF3561 family protein n=1 Tax=Entomohabitans teleogrylli TaxID=1384589 RepID=UPI00073DB1E7|nr:DUF3561 family protein [Entomohabitans teleogrylli]